MIYGGAMISFVIAGAIHGLHMPEGFPSLTRRGRRGFPCSFLPPCTGMKMTGTGMEKTPWKH